MSFLSWSADEGLDPTPAGLRIGEELGGYRLLEFLGQGGMGLVYRAQSASGQVVALKISHPDPQLAERLKREGELIAGLDHPGILRIYERGQVEGWAFMACELIEGARSLDELCGSEPRDVLLGHFRIVVEALAHAHERGVLHRDVKAENVLVDAQGRARLTDFGLGWSALSESLTKTGVQVGTPYAMAPEQLAGAQATPHSDVWGLGVLLYRILTRGELPFRGPSLEALTQQAREGEVLPPRSFDPTIPPALEGLCLSCLRPLPRDRPPHAGAIVSALGERVEAPAPNLELAHSAESLSLVPAAIRPHPIFSRFTLLELLGKGAMGSVHRARDSSANREVALKLVTLASPLAAERFEREALAMAKIHHPHVVGIHEVARSGNAACLVLDLVQGSTLRDRYRQGTLPARELAELVRQVASGLGAAHAVGLVHRDVKPSNVLVTREGRALLADFGVALDTARAQDRLTRSGALVGTPLYHSPEQARLERTLSPASDVFSLGVVLYEGLTGRAPFTGGNTLEILAAISAGDPLPPRGLNPTIPPDLEAIVLRCLRVDPSERYRDGAALAAALEAWQARTPAERAPARRALALGAACLVVLSFGVAGFFLGRDPEAALRSPAPSSSGSNEGEAELAARFAAIKELIDAGSLDAAEARVDRFRREAPHSWRSWALLGELHAGRKRYGDAALAFRQAIALKESVSLRLDLALVLHRQGDSEGAQREVSRALELDPQSAPAFCTRAMICYERRDMPGAAAAAEQALKLDPRSHDGYNLRGLNRLGQGQPREALVDFERALAIDRAADTLANMAIAYLELGDTKLAREHLDESLRKDPLQAQAYNISAALHLKARRFEEALQAIDRCLAIEPRFAQAHLHRSTALHGLGRDAEGKRSIERALLCAPPGSSDHKQAREFLRLAEEREARAREPR